MLMTPNYLIFFLFRLTIFLSLFILHIFGLHLFHYYYCMFYFIFGSLIYMVLIFGSLVLVCPVSVLVRFSFPFRSFSFELMISFG